MTPTDHSTRPLFERLRGASAQIGLLIENLDGPERPYSFDMGVGPAADVLDAIEREVKALVRDADRFADVHGSAWPECFPERMLFRPIDPVSAVPVETIGIVGERVRGVLAVTAAALRQGDVYVGTHEVHGALEAVQAMLAELAAVLDRVALERVDPPGSIHRPGMGPSRAWQGEDAA